MLNIAANSGSSGVVTVDGASSRLDVRYSGLCLGSGAATLNISGGARVGVGSTLKVSPTGTIAFGAGGGTIITNSLAASPSNFTGYGTINTKGAGERCGFAV